jgi:hypothetical protein
MYVLSSNNTIGSPSIVGLLRLVNSVVVHWGAFRPYVRAAINWFDGLDGLKAHLLSTPSSGRPAAQRAQSTMLTNQSDVVYRVLWSSSILIITYSEQPDSFEQ